MSHPLGRTMLAALVTAALAPAAHAGSHLWRFAELFSNSDGTIQFIEMEECCGSSIELGLNGKWLHNNANGAHYVFPNGLTGNSSHQKLLIGTQHFANLPGAPTPDYILPEGFLTTTGEDLEYWNYVSAAVVVPPLPLDGSRSWRCQISKSGGCLSTSTGVNSPTNFAGEEGSIVAPCRIEDIDLSDAVDVADLVDLILGWGPNPGHPADFDLNGVVDVEDLVRLILAWGDCPG